MKNVLAWFITVKDAVAKNKTIVLIDFVVTVVMGVTVFIGEQLFPHIPEVTIVVRWVGVAVILFIWALSILGVVLKGRDKLTDRLAHEIMSEKYGYEYEKVKVLAYLENLTREVRLHRRVHVKALTTQTSVRHYLHGLSHSTLGNEVRVEGPQKMSPPELEITVAKVKELSFDQRMVIEVSFAPYLEAGDEAEYEIKEVFPSGTFATSAYELETMDLPFEYLSWHVNRPMRALEYVMNVHEALNPCECAYDVWYDGYSQQRHMQEVVRLQQFFVEDRSTPPFVSLRLNIPYPVIGLFYVIKWKYSR